MSSLAARLTVTLAAALRVSMLVGEKLKDVSLGAVVSETDPTFNCVGNPAAEISVGYIIFVFRTLSTR
jgi:hypothetical protein